MINMQHETIIQCSPQKLFSYITQPWRWHEWHPSSVGAKADKPVLAKGDTFREEIRVQPLSPLPLTLVRKTNYEVLLSEEGKAWEVRGKMNDGWLKIRYDLFPSGNGTLFRRTLTFEIEGFKKIFLPLLLKPRMEKLSLVAMQNLKEKMEKE